MESERYKGKVVRVTEEEIGGVVWERAYLPDGVIIFPVTDEGKILLVQESRPHETPNVRIKPVAGMLEYDKGSPEENAQRELQEEIGFKAGKLELLMQLQSSGTVNNRQYFFIARDLIPSKLPNPDGEETIQQVLAYTPEELRQKILADELKWSMSTLGMFRLLEALR
jgi:8-oxo-dGTP pyrophosphatase MutT (NUDIX family)